MMFKAAVLSIALIGGLSNVAFAQANRGSQEDQNACEPDVHRLCDQFIPNEEKIVDCLKKQRKQLSPACAKVMR